MKNSIYKLICVVIMSISSGASAFSLFGSGYKNSDEIIQSFKGGKLTLIKSLSEQNSGYVNCLNQEIYFVKSKNRMFTHREELKINIDEIEFNDNSISVQLNSVGFKPGRVDYFINEGQKKTLNSEEFKCYIESSLSSRNIRKVYVNNESSHYHEYNNNHFKKIFR